MATFDQFLEEAVMGTPVPLTNTEHLQLLRTLISLRRRVDALLLHGLADQAGLRVPLDDVRNALRTALNKLDDHARAATEQPADA